LLASTKGDIGREKGENSPSGNKGRNNVIRVDGRRGRISGSDKYEYSGHGRGLREKEKKR